MTAPSGLPWWAWRRARVRLDQWVRTIIGARPYAIRYGPREGAYVDFAARELVVDPLFTAHFSADGLALPQTWGVAHVDRLSTLQVLSARAQAYHEGGHVRFTDWPPLCGETHRWLVNSLEDARMERLTAAFYPPAGRDFRELGHRLWLRGMEGIGAMPDDTTALLNACLFARWDEHRLPDTASRLRLPEAVLSRWHDQILPLVQEAWIAPSCAEVSRIALAILERLGLAADDDSAAHRPLLPGMPVARGMRRADDRPDAPPLDAPPPDPGPDPDADDPLLAAEEPDADPSAGDLWMQPYHALEAEVRGDVARLAAELAVAAPDQLPVANARRGRFESRAHVRSRGRTPVVQPADEADAPEGLAIVLLIDGTSSMGGDPGGVTPDGGPVDPHGFAAGRMPAVRRAVLHIERACAGAGVPLAIGVARDQAQPSHRPSRSGTYEYEYYREPVVWIKTFATPAHAEGPRALIAGLYGDAQAEAVSRSLRQVQPLLLARPERIKLLIYIHDGAPTDETPAQVRATIEAVRRAGIGVIGLFIGDQGHLAKMEAIFGHDTVGVASGRELAPRLGRILKRYRSR